MVGKSRKRMILVKIAFAVVLTIVLLEAVCRFYYHRLMPPNKRDELMVLVFGIRPDWAMAKRLKIHPYLWSNYAPFPGSQYANTNGWRYGGIGMTNAIRILCLGGSTTWGDGVFSGDQSYPAQMERYLRHQGYSVDVINGGCPYYTSAELVGTLAFRGIYVKPDIVIIHEGGNDTEPLLSPHDYKPDYSHWRVSSDNAAIPDRLMRFRVVWTIPSFLVRFTAWKVLQPEPFLCGMLGKQLTGPRDAAISTNDVANRVSAGYANNLRTLVAIARAHHSRVIFATFRAFPEKADRLIPELKGVQRERILKRLHWALDHNNAVMRDIGTELDVACIPFDQWNPSDPSCWLDQCHLDARGEIEKAEYFGQFLIDAGLLGGSPSVSAIRTLLGVENNGK